VTASSPGDPSTTLNSDAWSWGLEDQVHGPEPAAQVPQSGVREADPFRPLPRRNGPTAADPPGDRGALAGAPSYRTGRRERRLPADARNQGSPRQEARQASRSQDRVTAWREPRIRRAGGRAGTSRRALSARRQQVAEPDLLRGIALRLRRPDSLGRAWRGTRRSRGARREGRYGAARNEIACQHAAAFGLGLSACQKDSRMRKLTS
jgi:hypothetical protein